MASAAHSKAPVHGWVPSAPKDPAKYLERRLPSPGPAQWDLLQKWESIKCNGSSLGVSWRNVLVNTVVIGNSEDINLATVLLVSVCTQVGSITGLDLEVLQAGAGVDCPHGEVNHSAERFFTLPWIVMALLHCLSSHAPVSFTKLSMPH